MKNLKKYLSLLLLFSGLGMTVLALPERKRRKAAKEAA